MFKVMNAKKGEKTSTTNHNGKTNRDAGLGKGNKEKKMKHNILKNLIFHVHYRNVSF